MWLLFEKILFESGKYYTLQKGIIDEITQHRFKVMRTPITSMPSEDISMVWKKEDFQNLAVLLEKDGYFGYLILNAWLDKSMKKKGKEPKWKMEWRTALFCKHIFQDHFGKYEGEPFIYEISDNMKRRITKTFKITDFFTIWEKNVRELKERLKLIDEHIYPITSKDIPEMVKYFKESRAKVSSDYIHRELTPEDYE